MDILEASAQLERIELLAKIAHIYESNQREKTIALYWIGEIAGEMREKVSKTMKSPQKRGIIRRRESLSVGLMPSDADRVKGHSVFLYHSITCFSAWAESVGERQIHDKRVATLNI